MYEPHAPSGSTSSSACRELFSRSHSAQSHIRQHCLQCYILACFLLSTWLGSRASSSTPWWGKRGLHHKEEIGPRALGSVIRVDIGSSDFESTVYNGPSMKPRRRGHPEINQPSIFKIVRCIASVPWSKRRTEGRIPSERHVSDIPRCFFFPCGGYSPPSHSREYI